MNILTMNAENEVSSDRVKLFCWKSIENSRVDVSLAIDYSRNKGTNGQLFCARCYLKSKKEERNLALGRVISAYFT